jgi:hypothetical protein
MQDCRVAAHRIQFLAAREFRPASPLGVPPEPSAFANTRLDPSIAPRSSPAALNLK